jgi:SAM-dependent methyltransferase
MSFKDHFSRQAADYAKFRPQYPRPLFQFIESISPDNRLALDVATGNGQAAIALAEFFEKVIGIDPSKKQIAHAERRGGVEYRIASAESTGLLAHSCDAVTVAQALHWFDLDAFYAEARRILHPRGVLAVWAYTHLGIAPKIDAVVRRFYNEIVGPFWPPERRIVENGYRDLPFPFLEIKAPPFQIEERWTLEHLLGYLRTWSATQRFIAEHKTDPVDQITPDLAKTWGKAAEERLAVWPLTTRIGRA